MSLPSYDVTDLVSFDEQPDGSVRVEPLTHPASPRFASAWTRGYEARLRGVSRFSCPYDERPGWSGAYHRSWQNGWAVADQLVPPAPHVNVGDDYPEED